VSHLLTADLRIYGSPAGPAISRHIFQKNKPRLQKQTESHFVPYFRERTRALCTIAHIPKL
jgi:hypothetical protein